MAAGIGHPRGSAVWDYFEYNKDENECMHSYYYWSVAVSNQDSSNLCKHLEKSHSEAFKELEKKEEEKKQREKQSEKAKKSTCKSPISPQSIEACFSNKKLSSFKSM